MIVCLGNICRSPLAHGMLQQLADQQQLNWIVESSGTAGWHEGDSPDRRSVKIAKELGYDISTLRGWHFKSQFFEEFDYIFAMDKNNLKDILSLSRNEEDKKKVKLFLKDDEVTDPYYDDELFKPVALQIENRCKEIIKELV